MVAFDYVSHSLVVSSMEYTNLSHYVNLKLSVLHSLDTHNLPNIAVLVLNHSSSAFADRA